MLRPPPAGLPPTAENLLRLTGGLDAPDVSPMQCRIACGVSRTMKRFRRHGLDLPPSRLVAGDASNLSGFLANSQDFLLVRRGRGYR